MFSDILVFQHEMTILLATKLAMLPLKLRSLPIKSTWWSMVQLMIMFITSSQWCLLEQWKKPMYFSSKFYQFVKLLFIHTYLHRQLSYPDEAHGLVGLRPHFYHSLTDFLLNDCFRRNEVVRGWKFKWLHKFQLSAEKIGNICSSPEGLQSWASIVLHKYLCIQDEAL